jgi:hypothetical protein
LSLQLAGRNVEFVMNDEDLRRLNAIETRQRSHRLAGSVHEGLGHQQPHAVAAGVGRQAMKAGFLAEGSSQFAGQALTKPKPGVMPGFSVLTAGIAEADDKLRCRLAHRSGGLAILR